ncbi:GumC family protein [Mesorhizobium sp. RIZ17]|uniref:GumC family protein n=1 Tax=Mesorhizobium sp. RIZ17 TaxID=3132743 RepID=UPI003DA8E4C2
MVNQVQLLRPKPAAAPTHDARPRRLALEKMNDPTPLQQVLVTVWRQKWPILGMAILGGVLAGFVGMMRPPLYEASTQMIVDLPGSPGPAASAPQDMLAATVDGHLTVLSSEAHLRNVLMALRAADADHPRTRPVPAAIEPNSMRGIIHFMAQKTQASASSLLSWAWSGGRQDAAATSETADAAALKALKDGLRVGQELRSRIIGIAFTDRDPVRAAQVVNAVAGVYIGMIALQNRASDQHELALIASRLPEMQDELGRATEQLQTYRLTNGASDRGSLDDGGREIAGLGRQMSLVKASLAEVETRLQRARGLRTSGVQAQDSAEATGAPATIDPATGTAATGTPSTNEIDGQIARLDAERQVYLGQIASLQEQSDALKAAAADVAGHLSGLHALELKVDVISQRYNELLARQQDLQQRIKFPRPDVAVLSEARPPMRPVTLSPVFLVPPGMIVFGLATAVFALAWRYFDRTLRSEAEAEAALEIPCAGLLPKVARPGARQLCSLLLGQHRAPYTRAVGSLLISLAKARLRRPGVILILPSDEDEDKTVLAWSLALTATRLGERVLFVDFDQQEKHITRAFRTEFSTSRNGSSVASFLVGNRSLPETVEDMAEIHIDFMPAPPISNDLLHLVSTVDGAKVMDSLREKYTLVVLNGPSGLARPEARLLSSWADAVLLAVRWGKTPRDIARSVVEFIGVEDLPWNLPASLVSVLTQVNLKQHAGYRFGDSAGLLLPAAGATEPDRE